MDNPDVLESAGKRVVLLGNEAIARGALEAGCAFSACYPGTPSSEVGLTLADVAKETKKIYFEWSTNEKVATEVAAAASFCGVKSITVMKHFGLNVASDSLLPLAYTGVKGGMVLVVADDPFGHSSAQSEQDSRFFAKMGNFPVIEPSTVQECKDFTIKAFDISKKYQIPVILRTTTMISHATGDLKLGTIKWGKPKGKFVKDPDKYFNLRPHLQELHHRVLKKMADIENEYGNFNKIEGSGNVGIITCGVSYNYVKEVNPKSVKIAKLNLTHPISKSFVSRFLKGLKTVIVVEELEPVMEGFVRQVALEASPKVKVYGKNIFSRVGEYTPELVVAGLKKAGVPGVIAPDFRQHENSLKKIKIPSRTPEFCSGCPHEITYKAVKKVLGKNIVWSGDIGCYSIGIFRPYGIQDFVISMGASQGMAHGIRKVSSQKVVAFIGDSTFFHAGMSGLANIIYNQSDPLIIIMDNSITAMTGHQPHPGTGFNAHWEKINPIKIEDVVRGLGVKNIRVVNPADSKKMEAAIREFSRKKGPSVIISRLICAIYKRKLMRAGLLNKKGELK